MTDILKLLADPDAVHLNLLRGTLARPSPEQIIHLYGAETLRAALPDPPDPDARVAELERLLAEQAALLEERFSDLDLVGVENGVITLKGPLIPLLAEAMAQMLRPDGRSEPANYTEGPASDPVLLITRDADFSPCVEALERAGTPVICLSTEPPAVRLRRACSGWVELLRSGEAHYHVRTRLQGPANEAPRAAPKGRRGRKGRGGAAQPTPQIDADALLTRILDEEGVTPLPRLIALSAALRGVEAHLRAHPDRYHLEERGGQLRVSLMSPERAAYLALERALRELGPLPVDRLLAEARTRGLGRTPLPRRGILKTLEARPDLFRLSRSGEIRVAELTA